MTSRVWTRVHVQVLDGNTLFLSRDKKSLETVGTGGLQQGLQIVKANGIVTLPWIGDMWGIGSAPNTVTNVEVMDPPGAGVGP